MAQRYARPSAGTAGAERETLAQSAATTNRLLRERWSEGGERAYDQDLLDRGFPKEEARIDDGTLSRGNFGAALKRLSPSSYADAFSISNRHVREPLPLFELATSDPLFDGELSPWYADDGCSWEGDLKPLPLLLRGPGRGRPSNLARNAARKAGKRTRYAENKQEIAVKDHDRYLRNHGAL